MHPPPRTAPRQRGGGVALRPASVAAPVRRGDVYLPLEGTLTREVEPAAVWGRYVRSSVSRAFLYLAKST